MWNVSVRRGTQKKAQAVCHWLSPCLYDFYLFVLLSLYLAVLDLAAPVAYHPCSSRAAEPIWSFYHASSWAPPRAFGLSAGPHHVRAALQTWGTALPKLSSLHLQSHTGAAAATREECRTHPTCRNFRNHCSLILICRHDCTCARGGLSRHV